MDFCYVDSLSCVDHPSTDRRDVDRKHVSRETKVDGFSSMHFRKLATPPLVDHAFIALSFSELSRTIPLILKVSILKKVEFFGPLFFGVF